MYLNSPSINVLKSLQMGIVSTKPVGDILTDCHTASKNVDDPVFPYTYSGTLLAKMGRIDDAIDVLGHASTDVFSNELKRYLSSHGRFAPKAKVFNDPTPYHVWTKTVLYKKYLQKSLEAILSFAKNTELPSGKVTIFDVGTGNGIFITHVVNELAKSKGLKEVVLIINDQSEQMLESARTYIQANTIIPVTIVTLHGRIENLSHDQLDILNQHGPIWFINASASIHHMPRDIKITMLEKLSRFAKDILISDFHSNNDLPGEDTPEFVYSVTRQHYSYYIKDVLDCVASNEDKTKCIDDFLLAEAIVMLMNPRETRVDYHATIEQWEEIIKLAGFNMTNNTITVSDGNIPKSFTMHIRTK